MKANLALLALALLFVAGGVVEAAVKGKGKLWKYVGPPGGTNGLLPATASPAQYVSLAMDPATGTPGLAYTNGNTGLAYGRLQTAIGWLQVSEGAASWGQAQETHLAFHPDNSQPYLGYQDGNVCIVTRWNYTHWVPIDIPSAPAVDNLNLDYSSSTLGLVLAYRDTDQGNKASVLRYLNKVWMPIGSPAFTAGAVFDLSLAVAQGVPYIAFQDGSLPESRGRVMKFDSKSLKWTFVGKPFSENTAAYISLAIHPTTAAPWVFYQEYLAGALEVVRYTSPKRGWQAVGVPNFGLGSYFNSLAFDSAGTPHIAYQCEPTSKACVRRLDGTTWAPLGTQGLSVEAANYISLRFNKLTPYLAYSDVGLEGKAVVRTWA